MPTVDDAVEEWRERAENLKKERDKALERETELKEELWDLQEGYEMANMLEDDWRDTAIDAQIGRRDALAQLVVVMEEINEIGSFCDLCAYYEHRTCGLDGHYVLGHYPCSKEGGGFEPSVFKDLPQAAKDLQTELTALKAEHEAAKAIRACGASEIEEYFSDTDWVVAHDAAEDAINKEV